MRRLILLMFVNVTFAQNFADPNAVVGYIVLEKNGKVENYVVFENKDGSVKTQKVDKNPRNYLKKVEEGGQKK